MLDSISETSGAGADQIGSIARAERSSGAKQAAEPSEADLAYARAAAVGAIAGAAKDNSVPWENPHSGARGRIMPLAASSGAGGDTCRDFLASYVKGQSQAWLQGEACRTAYGKWEVKSLRTLRG